MSLIVNGNEIQKLVVKNKLSGELVDIEVLKELNGNVIWQLKENYLNFTGLDINGNMEGQISFNGEIIAYAVGKPNIKITETVDSETGQTVQNESISYAPCNGYNSKYYDGYDFSKGVNGHPDTQIIDSILIINDFYKGKPVTHILPYAFQGNTSQDQENDYYQASWISKIVFGENITTVLGSAFLECGNWTKTTTQGNRVNVILNEKLKYLKDCFNFCYIDKLVLPKSVKAIQAPFMGCNTLYVNSNIVTFDKDPNSPGLGMGANASLYTGCKTVVFEKIVTDVSGVIYYGGAGSHFVRLENLVFKHSDTDTITLDISAPKEATNIAIYTDNNVVKNYDWSSKNYTVTFKPLSEYVEK